MLFFRVPYFSVIREKETAIIVKPNGTVPPKLPCGNKKRVLGRKMNGSIFFLKNNTLNCCYCYFETKYNSNKNKNRS